MKPKHHFGKVLGIFVLEWLLIFGILSIFIYIYQGEFLPDIRILLLPTTSDQVLKISLIYTVLLFFRIKIDFKDKNFLSNLLTIIESGCFMLIVSLIIYWFYNSAVWYEFKSIMNLQISFKSILFSKITIDIIFMIIAYVCHIKKNSN